MKRGSTSGARLLPILFACMTGIAFAAWISIGFLTWSDDEFNSKNPLLRLTKNSVETTSTTTEGTNENTMATTALLLLTELAVSNPQAPSAEQVQAAKRLLSLLDTSFNKHGKGLGRLTTSVRALAEGILDRAEKGRGSSETSGVSRDLGNRGDATTSSSVKKDNNPDSNDLSEKDRLYTQQTCYVQTDESELCTYDNLLCFDGNSLVVTSDRPIRDPEVIMDYTHACMDYRYYEPTALEFSGCSYVNAGFRDYPASAVKTPPIDVSVPLKMRRWGPNNRNGGLTIREFTTREIWGDQPDRILRAYGEDDPALLESVETVTAGVRNAPADSGRQALPLDDTDLSYDTTILRNGPFDFPGLNGFSIKLRTQVGNKTINWVDGSVFITGLDGQWNANPYHWWSKIGALYDSQRVNRTVGGFGTHPNDGYIQHLDSHEIASKPSILLRPVTANRASWKIGAQWDVPSQDNILFVGDGAREIGSVNDLRDWYGSVLRLATQSHSKYFFNDLLTRLNNDNLLCTPQKSAIPSVKNKWFTGRSDAWLFRQYAYTATGLAAKGVKHHPKYPPRKITLVDRANANGRGLYNREEVINAVKATGVPYEIVPAMHALSFVQQVTLMSSTGILIAPHGAALANSMFLPAHSVVVEMFPYLMKKNTYRHLCAMMDLHYYPLYSWELLSPDKTQFYGVELMNEYYYWEHCIATNISSYDALNTHACNAASKNYPTVVPLQQFQWILKDAIDSIGAFSLLNPEWKSLAPTQGISVTPAPPIRKDEHGING